MLKRHKKLIEIFPYYKLELSLQKDTEIVFVAVKFQLDEVNYFILHFWGEKYFYWSKTFKFIQHPNNFTNSKDIYTNRHINCHNAL